MCVDKANQNIEDRGGRLPTALPNYLKPLDSPPPSNLTITAVTAGTPVAVQSANFLVDAARQIGWTAKTVTYDGSVEDLNTKVMAAVDDSNVVVLDGNPPAELEKPIEAAKKKGVLISLASVTDPPQSVPGYGSNPRGGDTFKNVGELAAYQFMVATNCSGNVAAFGLPFTALQNMAAGMEGVLKSDCPDCKFSFTEIPAADVGTQAATNAVTSKIQSDPSINFAFFTLGDLSAGADSALKQAGANVGVGGAFPTSSNLGELKAGKEAFWIGLPTQMGAWLTLDTILRALETRKPVVGGQFPYTVLTPENLTSVNPEPVYPADFEKSFLDMWHVG